MIRYLAANLKVMMRVPLAMFFSLAFPILMMVIIIVSYGNVDIGNGYHLIDKYFLIAVGIGMLPLSLISFPIWIASRFENNSLKRLSYFGVSVPRVIACDVFSHIVVGIVSILLSFAVALIFFQLKVPEAMSFFMFILQYIFILLVHLLIGAIIALIFPNSQILLPLGMTLMFALFMFCGVFIAFDQLPTIVQDIGMYLPMKYGMNDFFDIWNGEKYVSFESITVCASYMVVSVIMIFPIWRYRRTRM
jgi:ABC-2 type transport system permease protein